MNTFNNLFKAAKPSGKFQVPSESSTDEEESDWRGVRRRPMVAEDMVDTTSEDEDHDSDQDGPASYYEDYVEEKPDGDEAFVYEEKFSAKSTSKNPARKIWGTPVPMRSQPRSTAPPQRKRSSARAALDLTKFDTDDDMELEGEPDDEDSFIPVNQLTVKVTPKTPAGRLLKPDETSAEQKSSTPPQRQRSSPRPAPDLMEFDTDDDGELEGEPDDEDSFIPVNQLTVKVTPKKLAKQILKPHEKIARPKNPKTPQAKSSSASKDSSPPKKSQGTKKKSPSSAGGRIKPSPPRRPFSSSSSLSSFNSNTPEFQSEPPRPGPTSPVRNIDEPNTPNSSGSSGTPGSPSIEKVLSAQRVTRSQTRRVRKNNRRHFDSTPRRAGLTALSYEGRIELPVFQDAHGWAGRRVIYRPEADKYRGQGIRRDGSGESWNTRRRKPDKEGDLEEKESEEEEEWEGEEEEKVEGEEEGEEKGEKEGGKEAWLRKPTVCIGPWGSIAAAAEALRNRVAERDRHMGGV